MLIEIEDKIISSEVFERKFVCDLAACKGACCVEGDAGAPLSMQEVADIKNNLEKIKPYMRSEGIAHIEANDIYYMFDVEEPVTSLVNNAECVFVHFDDNNIAKCAIETAHLAGDIENVKPLSCHLYPIRVKKYKQFTVLNFDEWKICAAACVCGEQLNVPVYRFLKAPLIRAFGTEFYAEMEKIEIELNNIEK
jgi:hypothetical protein